MNRCAICGDPFCRHRGVADLPAPTLLLEAPTPSASAGTWHRPPTPAAQPELRALAKQPSIPPMPFSALRPPGAAGRDGSEGIERLLRHVGTLSLGDERPIPTKLPVDLPTADLDYAPPLPSAAFMEAIQAPEKFPGNYPGVTVVFDGYLIPEVVGAALREDLRRYAIWKERCAAGRPAAQDGPVRIEGRQPCVGGCGKWIMRGECDCGGRNRP